MSARIRSMTVQALAASLPDATVLGDKREVITDITYDSRSVAPGSLFAALRGAALDGHAYAADAERRGAAAMLVEEPVPSPLPQIIVSDSRASLARLASAFFGDPSRELAVIGITGTDGKTTTSYLVSHVLSAAGLKTGMVGTVAVRIDGKDDLHSSRQTTPESSDIQRYLRLMVEAATDVGILEATSHGLAMHRLDHVAFRVGAVTNITHEHLDYHGSIEAYRRAKAMLIERVAAGGGTVVINADDAGALAMLPFAAGAKVTTYSMAGRSADIQARDLDMDGQGSRFMLHVAGIGQKRTTLPYLGDFNVANALCAAGTALAAGVDLDTVAAALSTAPPVPGRMAAVEAGQPFAVVVDYAHTPDALQKVLVLLRGLYPAGRLISVFGSAGERDVEKRPLQGAVSARLADISVITSEDPRFEDADAIIAEIACGAREAGAIQGQTLFMRTDRRDAIQLAFELARPGDCVLLAGKGHEGSIIQGRQKRSWDEASVAHELLEEIGYSTQ